MNNMNKDVQQRRAVDRSLRTGAACFAAALAVLAISNFSVALSTLICVPFVVWMMFNLSIFFLPALAVVPMCTGYGLYTMETTAFVISLWKIKEIVNISRVAGCMLVLKLAMLPIVIYILHRNMSFLGIFRTESISFLLFYLPLFYFDWGLLCAKTWNKSAAKLIAFSFLILVLVQALIKTGEDGSTFVKSIFFIFPWAGAAGATWAFSLNKRLVRQSFLVVVISAAYIVLTTNTLTIIGTVVYAAALAAVKLIMKRGPLLYVMRSWLVVLATIGTMWFGMMHFKEYSLLNKEKADYDELQSKLTIENIQKRFQLKLFDDRAVLWNAGWNDVIQPPYVIPPLLLSAVRVETADGGNVETEMAVHNFYIQTLQNCRWVIGGVGVISYVFSVLLAAQWLRLKKYDIDLLPYCAAVFGTGIIHGMTANPLGGYPYYLMTFAGLLYWHYLMAIRAPIPRYAYRADET